MGNGNELRVYPKALKRSKAGFEDGAATLKKIFDRVESRLAAEGKCWGADKTGKAFEKEYLPASEKMMDAGPKVSKSLRDIAKGIDMMAKNYVSAEESSKIT
ncbi:MULTISPECIES: WXG100 family type VII secretion target [Thermomonospora]|uniref:Uncharacterized protein YukE n=1 Tax=Thermomonospora cellulosilytica TaxID=1411118 RepID=A0A7W3R6R3_9ACTN|nr:MULTISPECIES: hypothetical protein [Thermomonospora]MBA9001816.1 uncharacterized protein YukE [Thermomonospora cellulosilytica]